MNVRAAREERAERELLREHRADRQQARVAAGAPAEGLPEGQHERHQDLAEGLWTLEGKTPLKNSTIE